MPADPIFRLEPHASPVAASEREARLVDPGFGRVFSDHMAMMRWRADKGWHDPAITARGPLTLDPSNPVLHYAQEIFEGLKAYRHDDGTVALFRADANALRFRHSAQRLAMPELPDELFLASVRELVALERDWIPTQEGGSLYLRPFMIATGAFLGVRPAEEYLYLVLASAAGSYFKGGRPAVSLWVSEHFTRSAPGGTGAAKCGGNYAASLAAQAEAIAAGCDQVVFLDAAERRWVEELGGMNIFFVFADGSLQTPPLSGTILAGITRDSLITLARANGLTVREEPYAIDQWRADAESGRLTEAFACGTAAVVTPIATVVEPAGRFTIADGTPGPVTLDLRERLVGIQRGRFAGPAGWVQPVH